MRVLVTLTAYDPALPGTRTFYLTSGTAFTTTPSETPASQTFDPVLAQPLGIGRSVQGIGRRTQRAVGELRVANLDGRYDAWADYAFDGRAISVRLGPDSGAYPSDYPERFVGTMDRVDIGQQEIVIRLRDEVAALETPIQGTLYAGDNVAPDGLEGDETLAGVPKPLVYGRVRNVPLVPVNAQKLIYQVSDNQCASVDVVYDAGVPLQFAEGPPSSALTGIPSGVGISSVFNRNLLWIEEWGLFVLATRTTSSPAARIYTSPDFATWTEVYAGAAGTSFHFLAYSPPLGMLVAHGDDGVTGIAIRTTDQGATWSSATFTSAGAAGLAWGNGRFVAACADPTVYYSTDGVTWTASTTAATTLSGLTPEAVNYGGGAFLLRTTASTEIIWRSVDGETWVSVDTNHGGGGRVFGFEYLPDLAKWLLSYEGSPDGGYMQSTDAGVTWAQLPGDTVHAVPAGQIYSDRGLVMLAGSQTFVTTDGVTWTEITQPAIVYPLCFDGERVRGIIPSTNPLTGVNVVEYETYASAADLEDDTLAPTPGFAKAFLHSTGTYIRLGAQPFGQLTADVTHGAASSDRTAGQLIVDVLTKAGYTTGDWNATDITNLDTADNAEQGLYLRGTESVASVLDALAGSVGAWWGVDAAGVIRVQQLAAPSGSSTFDITEYDCLGIDRLASSDPLLGLPTTRTTLRYARNYAVQRDGLAGIVSAARRAELGREWKEAVDEDTAVLTTHLLARSVVADTLYVSQADALAEAQRRQTLFGTMRSAYRVVVPLVGADGLATAFAALELGQVGTLTHPRFGLSGGELVRVLGITPDLRNKTITLTLWR